MIRRHLRIAALIAFAAILVIAFIRGSDDRQLTETSYGVAPRGFRALYEVLERFGFDVRRVLTVASSDGNPETRWWLSTIVACGMGSRLHPDVSALLDALAAGGTAVVILPPVETVACDVVAGFPLPRAPHGASGSRPTAPPLHGDGIPRRRRLVPAGLSTFRDVQEWRVVARVGVAPFVVERSIGSGRLVVVADARVFANRWLDHADNVLFAFDLVRLFGSPRFDERVHGFRPYDSAAVYLASTRAVVVFVGLAVLAALYAWRSRLLPEAKFIVHVSKRSALEAYADSLARILALSPDHNRAAAAYRALTWVRLRRHFGLRAGNGEESVPTRRRGIDGREVDDIVDSAVRPIVDRPDVLRLAQQLDRLLWNRTR